MKTIFAATDFSEIGNNAVRYATAYANTVKAKLVVFHTSPIPKLGITLNKEEFTKAEQAIDQQNIEKLNQLINKIDDQINFTLERSKIKALARSGFSSIDTILAEAKKNDADLLIIGTHGKTALQLFGTTSAALILQSNIPVLAIPPGYQYREIHTLAYATDVRNLVNEVKGIVAIAKPINARIDIFHLDFGGSHSLSNILLDELKSEVGYDNIKLIVEKDVSRLSILEQIESHIKHSNPDILVMLPEGRSTFDRLFGIGKTEELSYRTQLPLLTFRKEDIPS